ADPCTAHRSGTTPDRPSDCAGFVTSPTPRRERRIRRHRIRRVTGMSRVLGNPGCLGTASRIRHENDTKPFATFVRHLQSPWSGASAFAMKFETLMGIDQRGV